LTSNTKLLSFDLDGTLIGDRATTKLFKDAWTLLPVGERPLLCYNTGRLLEDTLQIITEEGLPKPDYCICGVGTLMYDYKKCEIDRAFFVGLQQGWNRVIVSEIMLSLEGVLPQPEEFQNDFKSSWYLREADESQIDKIRKLFVDAGVDVNVVYSSSRDLDVLPRHATKGKALSWLLNKNDILPEDVVVGGDTGNDISMFLLPGVKGIIVANAQAELTEFNNRDGVYSSSKEIAEGVVEGLVHFGVLRS
jgi:sucrose-6F-phosphate phosphohydrolase